MSEVMLVDYSLCHQVRAQANLCRIRIVERGDDALDAEIAAFSRDLLPSPALYLCGRTCPCQGCLCISV